MEAIVAGHLCLDIIPELRGLAAFEPGRLIEAGEAKISTGGAVANTGQCLHRLGVSTHLTARIGEDLFGAEVEAILGDLSQGLVLTPGTQTSYTVVVNLEGRDRMFLHSPGTNRAFSGSEVTDELLADARLLHLGYPPLLEQMFEDDGVKLVALFSRAKRLGATTSLDMSLPDACAPSGKANWDVILSRVLPYVDIFLPSAEELAFMLEPGSQAPATELMDRALGYGAKVVGIKFGTRGLFMKTSDCLASMGRAEPSDARCWISRELWAPCFEVDAKGTTGAGDATIAGFLAALLRGLGPEECMTAATAAGAFCCEQPDAVSGVPSWEGMRRRIESGWRRRCGNAPEGWTPVGTVFERRTR